jgi:hypothetical protein
VILQGVSFVTRERANAALPAPKKIQQNEGRDGRAESVYIKMYFYELYQSGGVPKLVLSGWWYLDLRLRGSQESLSREITAWRANST